MMGHHAADFDSW